MQTVYLLWHQFEFRNSKEEELEERAKLIGVYTSEQMANQAIDRMACKPGFRDYQKGFLIDRYELNQDNWQDGFITLQPGEPPQSA